MGTSTSLRRIRSVCIGVGTCIEENGELECPLHRFCNVLMPGDLSDNDIEEIADILDNWEEFHDNNT